MRYKLETRCDGYEYHVSLDESCSRPGVVRILQLFSQCIITQNKTLLSEINGNHLLFVRCVWKPLAMAYHGNPTIRWLFEILGVQRGDLKEVQRLRQKWMQKNHPDKNPSEESREKSQLVNAAYDVFIQYEVQRQEEANAGAHSSPASGFAGNQGYTPPPDTGYTRNPWRAPPPPAHDDGQWWDDSETTNGDGPASSGTGSGFASTQHAASSAGPGGDRPRQSFRSSCPAYPHCKEKTWRQKQRAHPTDDVKLLQYLYLYAAQDHCLRCLEFYATCVELDVACESCQLDARGWASFNGQTVPQEIKDFLRSKGL